jgi:hypothetical protein
VTRVAALCAAASALLAARVCLALAPGRIVRITAHAHYPRDLRPVKKNPRDPRPVNPTRIRDLCWAITAIAARTAFSATCLEQAVALVMLLTIARIPANLVVGVARAESAVRAHAWVESGGVVVLGGTQSQGFTPLLRVGSSPPSGISASCPG